MNKTIIITGTTKGLGLTILDRFLGKEDYNIATISRSCDNFEMEYLLQFQGDIINFENRETFIKKVIEKFRNIDILINNAGVICLKPFMEYNLHDFVEIFTTNCMGSYFMTQIVIEQMLKQSNGGHIINIGSTRAITGAPNKSLYSMSKFALRGMNQCINAEFKDKHISSTIICPGQLDEIKNEVVDIIEFLIENDIKNIPEIRIGGML